MSLVSQQQLLQNQLQLKQLENQRNKQVQQSKSIVSSSSTNAPPTSLTRQQLSASSSNLNSSIDNNDQTNSTVRPDIPPIPQQVLEDPLSITIPTHANPTDILAARFNSWRIIISALSHYLKETSSVHEEITRQQIRLHHAISFPFLTQGLDGEFYQPMQVSNQQGHDNTTTYSLFHSSRENANANSLGDGGSIDQKNEFDLARKFFLPLGSGSIQDLPTVLYQYHSNAALLSQSTVKELNATIIPRLEDLKRDLLVKIKEIKSLQSDFKNQVDRYQADTSKLLSTYIRSIEAAKMDSSQLDPKNDPYLIRIALERSIRRQLTEENYLHEAFINIQTSGKELEKVVYIELQTALTVYAKLLGQQAQNVFDCLISKLDSTILTKEPSLEWDSFIDRDKKNFIELNLPMRKISEVKFKYQNDPLTYEIRSGWLERKSKFLKSYQRAWYVLTPCYLHEFKSSDRRKDPIPEKSYLLSELSVNEHSRRDDKNPNSFHKFVVMYGQSRGLLSKGHNLVFRAEGYDAMMSWFNDIKKLTQMSGPVQRSQLGSERRKSYRSSINGGDLSTTASILSKNRKRGVSSATALTATTATGTGIGNYNSNGNDTDFTSIVEEPRVKPNRESRKRSSLDVKETSLSRQHTRTSSINMGLPDNNDIVVMPVKPEYDARRQSIINEEPSIELGVSKSSPNIDASPSLVEQQQLLLQQQALLEKKQRQLLEEQRELQQRAFSLTSSMQQQQQHQHSLSMKSENHEPENLSEKVGEITLDSTHS